MTEEKLRPAVHFPPPTLFAAAIALGWILETKFHRIRITPNSALENIGIVLLIAGLVLMALGLITFARARTGIIPGHPARQVVTSGPYRYTRNPMYTGMSIAYIGGALILNSVWCLILFVPAIYLLYKLVIQNEESYLARAFPDEYSDYRRRVRRWI